MNIRHAACLTIVLFVTACAGPAPRPSSGGAQTQTTNAGRYSMAQDAAPHPDEVPADVAAQPDAVPQPEPRARSGNAPVYEVFGKTYRVLDDARGFHERGIASWYGKKFNGHKTASGETYDMYKMSAAHKSLPLPTYVRVTRVDNGRSVVVRVNDRGPFHPGRVIDLSYAAAAKLGMLGSGSTEVELQALDPMDHEPPSESWVQVAAYGDPINAIALREELRHAGHEDAQILIEERDGQTLNRVVLGPYSDTAQAQSTRAQLESQGYATTLMRP